VKLIIVGLAVVLLGGCVGEGTQSPVATPEETVIQFPLPTSGHALACAGVGISGPVLLEIEDGTTVARLADGTTLRIYWPDGFTSLFDPPMWRVLDADSRLFATGGDDITPFLKGELARLDGLRNPAGDIRPLGMSPRRATTAVRMNQGTSRRVRACASRS
jgi:hypothetical protein